MARASLLDCVIIGYNDIDLSWVDTELKPMRAASGGYRHFQSQTVRYEGRRRHYTDLLNLVLSDATGKPHSLHIADTPNLACCILKSFLQRRGLQVEIVNFFNKGKDRLADLLSLAPRAVAITTTVYTNGRPVAEIAEFVRRHSPDTKVLVGGPHVYNVCSDHDPLTQDYLFQQMKGDVFVFDSQGELTLSRILHELRNPHPDLSGIPNLVYTTDGETFERTTRQIEDNDLDGNVIDWRLFDRDDITPAVWMRTARSCAFSCAFCRYPALGGPLVLNDLRILEEQFRLLDTLGVRFIYFIDDTFNVPLPRFKDLCRMMVRNHFNFKWASYFRCANADDETFDLIRDAGCVAVFAGIESGDQGILKNMNKAATVERYKYGMRKLLERDIMVLASFIIGFPGETEASVHNTLAFIEETRPTFYSAEVYFHDPKVPVQERAKEFGLDGAGYSWTHKTMNWEKATELVEMLHRTIKHSAYVPLYGVDVWSVPYFLSRGVSREQLMSFLEIARAMVVKGLADPSPDYGAEAATLHSVFAPTEDPRDTSPSEGA